jgi:hypothetical protein
MASKKAVNPKKVDKRKVKATVKGATKNVRNGGVTKKVIKKVAYDKNDGITMPGTEYGHLYKVVYSNNIGMIGVRNIGGDVRIRIQLKADNNSELKNEIPSIFKWKSKNHASYVSSIERCVENVALAVKWLSVEGSDKKTPTVLSIKKLVNGVGVQEQLNKTYGVGSV